MNGNAIVGWLKKHWLIVVLSVVALVALPAALYAAQMMNDATNEEFGKKVAADYKTIEPNSAKVSYSVPGVDGGRILEKSGDANQLMIDKYGEIWATIRDKTGAVSERGLSFNKSDHALLIEALFPRPNDLDAPVKGREFVRAYIDFHPKILAEARAGGPPAPEAIAQQLTDFRAAQVDRIKAEQNREPTPEEAKKIADDLMAMRIGRVTARASEIAVYATPSVFDGVPTEVPNQAPALSQLWDFQERAWIHRDILRAVKLANGDSAGGVAQSVVKRITRVSVRPPTWGTDGRPTARATEAGEEKAPLDFSRSITGRVSGAGSKNKWYDVRVVDLDIIVSSKRLPQFIDALGATNFMSVLEVRLQKVEPLLDMRDGYFYGDEHVVRATLAVEYILLREWRKANMPDDVQRALGMVEGVNEDGTGGAPAAAPPPRRAAPPPRDGAGAAPARGGRRNAGGDD